jgi:hypothetical protein
MTPGQPITTTDPRGLLFRPLGFSYSKDREAASKYRALRTLAINANDHVAEMELFANEMKARRFWLDRPLGSGSGRFWLGWLYDVFSDFGRSISRPTIGWCLIQVISAAFYFGLFIVQTPALAPNSVAGAPCISGRGAPIAEAFVLALSNGLVVGGVNSERIKIAQACLFGVENDPAGLVGVPRFPVSGVVVSIVESILSVVTLFLIGLSIRNNFRIQ